MKLLLPLVFTLSLQVFCYSQKPDSLTSALKRKIVDFVEFRENVFAISDNGRLLSWTTSEPKIQKLAIDIPGDKITAIALNKGGELFAGTEKGNIYKLSPDGQLLPFLKTKYPIKFLAVNSEGRVIAIVPNAVYDPVSGKYWEKFGNHTNGLVVKRKGKRVTEYFQMPQYIFLDARDILWMTASFGEFGGDIEIFDTRTLKIVSNKFDSIDNGLLFPKSVFEGPENNVIVTSGLQHFMNSGEIFALKTNGKANKLFKSSGHPVYRDRRSMEILKEGGLFIGPGTYNPSDSSIYFASNKGIHKARLIQGLKISQPELLGGIEVGWSREPLAIGMKMAFKKLSITGNGGLIFLTENKGIGILHEGKVTFLE